MRALRIDWINGEVVPVDAVNDRHSEGRSVLVYGGQQWGQPVVANLAVSVQEDHHVSGGCQGSVISGPYQPFSLSVPHELHFGIVNLLQLLLQLLVEMLEL